MSSVKVIIVFCSSGEEKSEISITVANSRCWQSCIPSGHLRWWPYLAPLGSSCYWGYLNVDLWFQYSCNVSSSLCCIFSIFVCNSVLQSFQKYYWTILRGHRGTPGCPLHLKLLNWVLTGPHTVEFQIPGTWAQYMLESHNFPVCFSMSLVILATA